MRMAMASVSEGSQGNYLTHWRKWLEFQAVTGYNVGANGASNELFQGTAEYNQQVEILEMFIAYCYDILKNKAPTVAQTLSGVRYHFQVKGWCNKAFDDVRLARIRGGAAKKLDSKEGRNKKEEEKRVPITALTLLIMLDHMSLVKSLRNMALSVGLVLGYFGCLRVSNYVPKPTCEEHCITLGSVEFAIKGKYTDKVDAFYANTEKIQDCLVEELVWVRVNVPSGKTKAQGEASSFYLPARDLEENMFNAAHYLFHWARARGSGGKLNDPFISYREFENNRSKIVCPKYDDCLKTVKKMAEEMGIPLDQAGTQCMRIGAATQLKAIEAAERQVVGGSSSSSSSSSKVYKLGDWAEGSSSASLYMRTAAHGMNEIYQKLARIDVYSALDLEMACNPNGRRDADGVRPKMSQWYYDMAGLEPGARVEGIQAAIKGARVKPSKPVIPLGFFDGGAGAQFGRPFAPYARKCFFSPCAGAVTQDCTYHARRTESLTSVREARGYLSL